MLYISYRDVRYLSELLDSNLRSLRPKRSAIPDLAIPINKRTWAGACFELTYRVSTSALRAVPFNIEIPNVSYLNYPP